MRDGPQRGNEEIILAWEHHVTTVLYVVLFPMLAINRDVSRTMRHAAVIQTVKQHVQRPREIKQRRYSRAAFNTCCRLIKVCRIYHQPTITSSKTRQGSQD
jgi:hypothetical protein